MLLKLKLKVQFVLI